MCSAVVLTARRAALEIRVGSAERNLPVQWRYLLLLAISLVGCKASSSPKMDPFLGPTTVPPPGTAYSPATVDPYYSNPGGGSYVPQYGPQGSQPSASAGQLASANNSPSAASSSNTTPGSGWVSPQISGSSSALSSVYQQAQSAGQLVEVGSASRGSGQIIQASHSQTVRVEEPRPGSSSNTSSSLASRVEPARFVAPTGARALPQAIDIMDLPPVTQAQQSAYRTASSIATQANYAAAEQQPSKIVTLTRSGTASFARHPDWQWLQGRLEQSAEGGWKLHYQASGEAADRFGGRIELAQNELLEGFRHGDLVTVQGTLDGTPGRYEPAYRVERIELQQ